MTEEEAETDEVTETEPDSDSESDPESDSESDPDSDSEASESSPAPLPGEGTPDGETLREAEAAFTRGDYVRVRELTSKLLEASDDEVARHARELERRTKVDPVQIGVIGACLALFAYIVYTYVLS